MQTYLNKNTTFFQRLLKLSEYKGFNSLNKFAIEGLNYSSSEKLNRLKKENTNPSVDILLDISNKFEDINLDWLITGNGEMLKNVPQETFNTVQQPDEEYKIELSIEAAQKKTISILENVVDDLRNDKEVLNTIIKSILNK
jgi:hypothetical protein